MPQAAVELEEALAEAERAHDTALTAALAQAGGDAEAALRAEYEAKLAKLEASKQAALDDAQALLTLATEKHKAELDRANQAYLAVANRAEARISAEEESLRQQLTIAQETIQRLTPRRNGGGG